MKHRSEDPAVPTSAKALPCPWCGSLKLKILFTDEDRHRSTWVYCSECQASGPTADGEVDSVLRWNTRILSLAPQSKGGGSFKTVILIFSILAFLTGCSSVPAPEDAKVYIEIRNTTSEPVYGFLVPGWPFPSAAVTVEPHGTREYWVPRGWIPERLIFSVVEKKKQ